MLYAKDPENNSCMLKRDCRVVKDVSFKQLVPLQVATGAMKFGC